MARKVGQLKSPGRACPVSSDAGHSGAASGEPTSRDVHQQMTTSGVRPVATNMSGNHDPFEDIELSIGESQPYQSGASSAPRR
eukprot:8103197-Pyramimonas_sp.AAC.1